MFVDGSESDADLGALKELGAVMVLLKIAPSLSRVHASRRVFEQLQQQQVGSGWGPLCLCRQRHVLCASP